MKLRDRFAAPAQTTNDKIECTRYETLPGTRRCRHYVDGGSCALPDELQCIEWLRANGHARPSVEARSRPSPAAEATTPPRRSIADRYATAAALVDDVERDLFGDPVTVPPKPAPKPAPKHEPEAPDSSRPIPAPARPEDAPLVRNLTADEVASFKALGAEVCLASDAIGQVWIVPEYTNQDRSEISVEHAATLAAICSAFPGAKVVGFERRGPSQIDPEERNDA